MHRPTPLVTRPVAWGLGDAVAGFVLANLCAVVAGALILAAAGQETTPVDELSLTMVAALQVPLWVGYLGAPLWAARRKGHGIVEDFGFRMRWSDIPIGLAVGVATQLIVIPLLYVPIFWITGDQDISAPARSLTDRATDPTGVVLLILIVVVGAPIIEELFFRGLFLRSVERRFGSRWALVVTSVVFGAIHLELLQFPALTVAGLVFGGLALRSGRLGPSIWAHIGFNGVAVLTLLSSST